MAHSNPPRYCPRCDKRLSQGASRCFDCYQWERAQNITRPDQTGRVRAENLYPMEPCEVCGMLPAGRGSVERHHIDSDRMNNARSNIAFLCRKHHIAAHRAGDGKVGRPTEASYERLRAPAKARARRIVELRAAGLNHVQIAREMGLAWATVRSLYYRYGRDMEKHP